LLVDDIAPDPISCLVVFATKSRLTEDFEVERALASTSVPTGSRVRPKRRVENAGEHLLEHEATQGVAIGEVLIGAERCLSLASANKPSLASLAHSP